MEHEAGDPGPQADGGKVDISSWNLDLPSDPGMPGALARAEAVAKVDSVEAPKVASEKISQALETSRDAGQRLIERAKRYPESLPEAAAMPQRLKERLDFDAGVYAHVGENPATVAMTEQAAVAKADTLSTLVKSLMAVDSAATAEVFNVDGSEPQAKDDVDSAIHFIQGVTGVKEPIGLSWDDLAEKAKKGEPAIGIIPLGLDLSFTVHGSMGEGGKVDYQVSPTDTRPGRLEQAA